MYNGLWPLLGPAKDPDYRDMAAFQLEAMLLPRFLSLQEANMQITGFNNWLHTEQHVLAKQYKPMKFCAIYTL